MKRLTLSPPRRRSREYSPSTARVVVFTPPPQEPGEAPKNMRKITKVRVLEPSVAKSTVLKPAVRAEMDWKSAGSQSPRDQNGAPERVSSKTAKMTVPAAMSIALVTSTSLACRESRLWTLRQRRRKYNS